MNPEETTVILIAAIGTGAWIMCLWIMVWAYYALIDGLDEECNDDI